MPLCKRNSFAGIANQQLSFKYFTEVCLILERTDVCQQLILSSALTNTLLSPLMPEVPKNLLAILGISLDPKHLLIDLLVEMLIRTPPTTLLQIFCEFMLNSKVILKSILDPDDTCLGYLQAWMG